MSNEKKEHWLFDREYKIGLVISLLAFEWLGLAYYLSDVRRVFPTIEEAWIPSALIIGVAVQVIIWIKRALKHS